MKVSDMFRALFFAALCVTAAACHKATAPSDDNTAARIAQWVFDTGSSPARSGHIQIGRTELPFQRISP